ncbi:MAG: MotA/TolQ/ExbB proton channel family protein [Betaproteobacteria bacterium]|nr:MotA/TolQ/ExbB proton channel family protein [Betaproteobacteria bacterium]
MFSLIQAAGWPIWFLLAASVVAVTVIVERILYLRSARVLPTGLLNEVISAARAGPVSAAHIDQLERHSPLGAVLAAALRTSDAPREHMLQAVEDAGRAASLQLERYLTALGTVATLAPLMGLFGTVVGMIELFGAQDVAGADPLKVAHGISVALYNTAFGLAVAMPALLFHRHFQALIDRLLLQMEQQAMQLVNALTEPHDA